MTPKVKEILEKFKGKKAVVFIDDANIFHLQQETNIRIGWKALKIFFQNYFQVLSINYYRGYYPKSEIILPETLLKHKKFDEILEKIDFKIIGRPLKKIFTDSKKSKYIYKCDFDGEIGYDIAENLAKSDLIILLSGDSDFTFLADKLNRQNKKLLIVCFRYKAPWEFLRLTHIFFEEIQNEVGYKNTRHKDG